MTSIADQLQRRLAPERVDLLRRASAVAARRGARLYLVGGAVRDVLLGGRPADLDVVAYGNFAGLPDALASGLGGRVTARSQFETAKLAVGDFGLDLTAARSETYARPGALPDVRPGTMRQDLARRDFSINAMAVSLSEDDWGALLDPHGGAADLRAAVVRVLHPGSFVDDATRILRAVRYAGRLGFEIEVGTRRLLERGLGHLDGISGDRLRRELRLLLAEDEWHACLRRAQEHGVLGAVHPALALGPPALDLLEAHPDVSEDTRLAALLSFAGPRAVDGVAARLNMSGGWADVARDVAGLSERVDRLEAPRLRPSRIYALLHGVEPAAIEGVALTCGRPRAAERMRLYLDELRHVQPMLDGSDLDEADKTSAKRVFRRLAEAEASVHGVDAESVGLHEAGSLDAVVDIAGAVAGLRLLGATRVYSSALHCGTGSIDCAHGRYPLPAPGVLALCRGVPLVQTEVPAELVTPTGAALITTLAEAYGAAPAMRVAAVGYGAGSRDLETAPNVVRLRLSEPVESAAGRRCVVLEANVDDMNPEVYGYLFERLLEAGARDLYVTPVLMKKNRPGHLLSVLADPDRLEAVSEVVLGETTSLGVRHYEVERRVLERSTLSVETEFGPVRVKVARMNGGRRVAPEYDDCAGLARRCRVPILSVYGAAVSAAEEENG